MLGCHNKKSGFTLIEILISLLLGSVLLAMVISLYVTNVTASAKALKFSRLRTDLQALVALMEEDIRRAGYGGNEYMVGAGKAKVIDSINSTTQKCIVYAYNYDQTDSATTSHFMAFRYSIKNKSVQFGKRVDIQASNCFSSGTWVNLTYPEFVKVTELSFVESVVSNAQVTIRSVDIHVAAELVANSDYKHQLQTRIQVRNREFH
ncbi:prepilin-type N-terminal cleavage/methylation domain-containing protein [Psychromonas sp. RZ22]|uniref:prepilin-type N-terminal cleavage/methylation domain-containing protein n=1 Tax=Psychromonas algarum TaxID=2555643 RepID=UPI0010674CAF|nr:prepilin-type N-terminal cleavage/methylation domain-containing protein [Psychromonas sp. RZ22]TEW53459.1 prepilin-type N-terminal cleavage/methylation domain-containing protein [Psychromonas sp. RZ22]